jgi:hypothetical protein
VWEVKSAAFSAVVLLATNLGCNSILGIDAATLEPSDAGQDAQVTALPTEGGTACSLQARDPCNACIAQNCCTEYDACLADDKCKSGLVQYAFCLGKNFTSDAGVSCDEDFVTVDIPRSSALVECALGAKKCGNDCSQQTIGDLCFTYCGCMASVCSDFGFDAGTCTELCGKFDENQLVCRPYHCNLATQNMLDEPKRLLHCGHASGNPPCH